MELLRFRIDIPWNLPFGRDRTFANHRLSCNEIRGVAFLPNPTLHSDDFHLSRLRETNGLTRRYISESFLPSSVPDLELHPLPEDLGRLDLEVNPEQRFPPNANSN